jgi:hypothetical protein
VAEVAEAKQHLVVLVDRVLVELEQQTVQLLVMEL